nr:hypothetical protein [Pandoravirus aubagnensis]
MGWACRQPPFESRHPRRLPFFLVDCGILFFSFDCFFFFCPYLSGRIGDGAASARATSTKMLRWSPSKKKRCAAARVKKLWLFDILSSHVFFSLATRDCESIGPWRPLVKKKATGVRTLLLPPTRSALFVEKGKKSSAIRQGQYIFFFLIGHTCFSESQRAARPLWAADDRVQICAIVSAPPTKPTTGIDVPSERKNKEKNETRPQTNRAHKKKRNTKKKEETKRRRSTRATLFFFFWFSS